LVYLAQERRLYRCHHLGLSLTFRAPCDSRLGRAPPHDNLVFFIEDSGMPLNQVPILFRL